MIQTFWDQFPNSNWEIMLAFCWLGETTHPYLLPSLAIVDLETVTICIVTLLLVTSIWLFHQPQKRIFQPFNGDTSLSQYLMCPCHSTPDLENCYLKQTLSFFQIFPSSPDILFLLIIPKFVQLLKMEISGFFFSLGLTHHSGIQKFLTM